MAPECDLFANFERMRREMDELFGDVFDRTGLAPARRGGFSPAVDGFYQGEPPRAVVQAELAGIDPGGLAPLRPRRPRRADPGDGGRRARKRGPPPSRRRRGPPLPAARDRLRPVPTRDPARRRGRPDAGAGDVHRRDPAHRAAAGAARVADAQRADRGRAARRRGGGPVIEITGGGDGRDIPITGQRALPAVLPVLPLRETVPLPDTLTPLAIGQDRSIELVNDVLAGNRMLVMVASKKPELEQPGPDDLHRVGVVGSIAAMLKVPDGAAR